MTLRLSILTALLLTVLSSNAALVGGGIIYSQGTYSSNAVTFTNFSPAQLLQGLGIGGVVESSGSAVTATTATTNLSLLNVTNIGTSGDFMWIGPGGARLFFEEPGNAIYVPSYVTFSVGKSAGATALLEVSDAAGIPFAVNTNWLRVDNSNRVSTTGTYWGNGSSLTNLPLAAITNLVDLTNEVTRQTTLSTNHSDALSANATNEVYRQTALSTNHSDALSANATNEVYRQTALSTNHSDALSVNATNYFNSRTNTLIASTSGTGTNTSFYPSAYNSVPLNVYGNTFASAFMVNSNGNVGVGTANPSNLLHIGANEPYAGWVFDAATESGMIISPNVNSGCLLVEGNQISTLVMVDRNAGNDLKTFQIINDGGITKFRSIVDSGASVLNTALVIDHSTGSVGIGTTTPYDLLHVNGSIMASNSGANGDLVTRYVNDARRYDVGVFGSSGSGTYDPWQVKDITASTIPFSIAPGCASSTLVLTNGNVGVGTADPTFNLVVGGGGTGAANATGIVVDGGSGAGSSAQLRMHRNSILQSAIYAGDSAPMVFYAGLGERMVLDSSGRIGIGTTVPAASLHVTNTLYTTSPLRIDANANTSAFTVNTNGLTTAGYGLTSTGNATVNGNLIVTTNGLTDAELNAGASLIVGGSILIGTQTPVGTGFDLMMNSNAYVGGFLTVVQTVRADKAGIGIQAPVTTLHVTNTVLTTAPLRIDAGANVNALSVNTNGVTFVRAETNGVAPPPYVAQPVGLFAQLSFASTNTIDMAYETYTNIANGGAFSEYLTNGFYINPATGFITNQYAGFYRVAYSFSVQGSVALNGDELEAEVFINGVGDEHTANLQTVGATAGFFSMGKDHIVYLPANSYVEIKVKNISDVAQDIGITRATFVIGAP